MKKFAQRPLLIDLGLPENVRNLMRGMLTADPYKRLSWL